MDEAARVNFHTHTIFSDGEQTPEALAASLAEAGVRYAALTDHDTVEGLARFGEALDRLGIPSLSGVELTTQHQGRELHLVAYGFDPDDPELAATLVSMRQARSLDVHSIAGSLRKAGSRRPPAGIDTPAGVSAAPNGTLEIGDAIALLHRAGGRAFWAHPLVHESDPARLDGLIAGLKAKGLDGIEAVYAQFSTAEQALLRQLARKHDLPVCAGTDFHGPTGIGNQPPGIDMPRDEWLRFRAAMFSGPAFSGGIPGGSGEGGRAPESPADPGGRPHRFRRRAYVLRIALPTLAALALFLVALWALILPSFERTLLERKREMIRELTNSAESILAAYQRDEQGGVLTRDEAQSAAAGLVRQLRYGPDGKDYFWIQDTAPRMIMHPYRTDLNGQDLSGFTDPRGVPIFVEFADLVQREGQGYVDYVWQWQDDPERLEPKESYVKGFTPWGWIIGTGLYTDDVRQEIGRIEQNLIIAALAISGAIAVLLLFVLQQSLRIERRRQEVVEGLRDSTERYHTLVEATTEGTLLVLDGRCRYANPTFLGMLGYTSRQLEFLELADLLPRDANAALWEALESGDAASSALGEAREGCLSRSDGSVVECILTLEPIEFDGQPGTILLARDVAGLPATARDGGLALAAPAGIFRAVAARRGVFLETNPAARELLSRLGEPGGPQPALADCFADPAEFDRLLARLLTEGEVKDHILRIEAPDGVGAPGSVGAPGAARFLSLSAALVRDEQLQPAFIDGLLVDVTAARDKAAERDALIEKLQASLLFLHEPIASLAQEAVVVGLDTGIGQLARQMTERHATAALVASGSGAVIGIVTDHDLRARALAEGRTPDDPVHTVMSAPLLRIPEGALVYEALMRMEEHGVRHLAVEDANGAIVSVIDNKALVQFPRYGPIVLLREIARAGTQDEVARCCGRAIPLAGSLMDSSTRPRHITSMLTSICDAATQRLIELSVEEMGLPPAPFAFIAMGSQGRGEQTLLTDQDNGIIFAATGDPDADGVGDYFLRLGTRVCDGLQRAGYAYCRGKVMANDPRWCHSLPGWLSVFDTWVRRAEPQDIADLSVFVDFRVVHGDAGLVNELRGRILATLPEAPAVLYQFARNALTFKPPIRLPGNIYLGGGAEHAGEIDLKDALMPIVAYARVDALRHRITHTHTLERIDALADRDLLPSSSRDEIAAVYDFLMQLRLQSQLAAIRAGRPPTSSVQVAKLGHTQRELLRQAFTQIAAVQKRIGYEFPEAG
jgi:PAS domain S-box-containing protein